MRLRQQLPHGLLRNVKVAAYIREDGCRSGRSGRRSPRTGYLEELAAIAFARATDYRQIVKGRVRHD